MTGFIKSCIKSKTVLLTIIVPFYSNHCYFTTTFVTKIYFVNLYAALTLKIQVPAGPHK